MIDEAIGKILGMVMAYVASALGMFVAYVNYRRRIVKADRVMTPTAWAVVVGSVLAIVVGGLIVVQLAAPAPEQVVEEVVTPEPVPTPVAPAVSAPADVEQSRWPWVGIVLPAAIFLFATVVTAALHRHFSTAPHP